MSTFSQLLFLALSQLNSVVRGIKEKIGSKRNPLILLHHRRTKGGPANSPHAIKMLKRWQEAHTIYTTPTGSNDDWYVQGFRFFLHVIGVLSDELMSPLGYFDVDFEFNESLNLERILLRRGLSYISLNTHVS